MRLGFRARQPGDQLISRWTQQGIIRSVQQGVHVLMGVSAVQAIQSVDMANSIVRVTGFTSNGADAIKNNYSSGRIVFTSPTQLTIRRFSTATSAASHTYVGWEVVEYYPGIIKSIQRVEYTHGAGTLAISPVNRNKTLLAWMGTELPNASGAGVPYEQLSFYLSSDSSITFQSGSTTGQVVGLGVVEFI